MNFRGPSMTVDSACSASLTALQLASQAIARGEVDAALVAGINLDLHPAKRGVVLEGELLSRQGRCMPFGADCDGYVTGEGVGALLLKPLDRALADGDYIHGVIKGIVLNHDGAGSGYTVPNAEAHAELISRALKDTAIDPRSLGYIEAHGTGTAMGDAIEVEGMTVALENAGLPEGSLPIGSIKSNFGHLEAAAGMAGLTRVLLQLSHRTLTPSLHAAQPSDFIDFETTPFRVQQETESWQPITLDGKVQPLRAGLNSFGAGGANAHVLLEQAPDHSRPLATHGADLYVFSAADDARLKAMAQSWLVFLDRSDRSKDSAAMAHTLRVGRRALPCRLAIRAEGLDELRAKLNSYIEGQPVTGLYLGKVPKGTEGADEVFDATRLEVLAKGWISGEIATWHGEGHRLSLPTYPFAATRYWIDVPDQVVAPVIIEAPPEAADVAESNEPAAVVSSQVPTPESGDLTAELCVMAAEIMNIDTAIPANQPLKELDFDSLNGLKLLNRMRERFGRKISLRVFLKLATINDIVAFLVSEGYVCQQDSDLKPAPAEARVSSESNPVTLGQLLKDVAEGRITPKMAADQKWAMDHPQEQPEEPVQTSSEAEPKAEAAAQEEAKPVGLLTTLCDEVANILKTTDQIDPDVSLKVYEFDSLNGLKLLNRIRERYGRKIPVRTFLKIDTTRELAAYLVKEGLAPAEELDAQETKQPEPKAPQPEVPADSLVAILEDLKAGRVTPDEAIKRKANLPQARV